MKCEFCNSELEYESSFCRHCGAPCKFVKRPATSLLSGGNDEDVTTKNSSKDPDDLRPMGSPDISFLTQQVPLKKKDESGCLGCLIIVGFLLVIIAVLIKIVTYFFVA